MEIATDILTIHPPFSEWEDARYHCRWKGFLFIRGTPAGGPSLKEFSRLAAEKGIGNASAFLSGTFFLAARDKQAGDCHCLVDNAGLSQAFYSARRVSTSFLGLIKAEGLTAQDLEERALVEFIQLGNVFFNRTFFPSIRKIDADQIIRIEADGKLNPGKKNLPPLFDNPPAQSFLEIFSQIHPSLAGREIGVDLTGGFDSRFLAGLLRHLGLRFTSGVSGADAHLDVILSRRAAQHLEVEHLAVNYTLDGLADKVREAFEACDALADPFPVLRIANLQKERRQRGIDLVISGGGGEIFDDFFWLQDYPFYGRARAHCRRLFELRFRPIAPDHRLFAGPLQSISRGLAGAFSADLERFRQSTNTRTYDDVFVRCRWKENLGRSLTAYGKYLDYYAPLMEYDLMRIAVSLPCRQRLHDSYCGAILKSIDPELAKLPLLHRNYMTVMQYSFLAGPARDAFLRLGQNLATRSFPNAVKLLIKVAKTPGLAGAIQALPEIGDYDRLLKSAGILDPGVDLSRTRMPFLGRFVSLAMLLERLRR